MKKTDVYPYDTNMAPMTDVPIVTGATAYDDPITGQTFILIINEALYYGSKLDHSLFNPNQIRFYGIDYWDNPFDQQRKISIGPINSTGVVIPLQVAGTKIQFESRAPTAHELQTCLHIPLTSKNDWDPSSVVLSATRSQIQPSQGTEPPYSNSHSNLNLNQIDSLEFNFPLNAKEIMMENATRIAKISSRLSKISSYDENFEDLPTRQSYTSNDRHSKITAELIADRFAIGLQTARATMKATLMKGTRSALLPLSRRYRSDRIYSIKRLQGKFSTDTLYFKRKTLTGNIGCQLFSHKSGFTAVYPITKADGEQIGNSLRSFIADYGVPEHLIYDGAKVQVGRFTIFQKTINDHQIKPHVSAPYSPNQNPSEGSIRETKRRWYRLQAKKNVPDRLTDFGIKHISETGNVTANSSRYLQGRTPIEFITGETPDICEYIDFGFYDYVYYRTNGGLDVPSMGRWLGVSHRVGKLMSYWILSKTGRIVSCSTVQRITNL